MLDFLYTPELGQSTCLSDKLRKIYPDDRGDVHAVQGDWGCLAFYVASWSPSEFVDDGHFIAVVIGRPRFSWSSGNEACGVGENCRAQRLLRRWRLGHAPFARGGEDDGAVWLGDGARAVARFGIRERPRGDAGNSAKHVGAQGALRRATG